MMYYSHHPVLNVSDDIGVELRRNRGFAVRVHSQLRGGLRVEVDRMQLAMRRSRWMKRASAGIS
jgi:hypothetical protein